MPQPYSALVRHFISPLYNYILYIFRHNYHNNDLIIMLIIMINSIIMHC